MLSSVPPQRPPRDPTNPLSRCLPADLGGCHLHNQRTYSPEIQKAIEGVQFIAQHIKDADRDNEECEDWKFIAMVLDRLFLILPPLPPPQQVNPHPLLPPASIRTPHPPPAPPARINPPAPLRPRPPPPSKYSPPSPLPPSLRPAKKRSIEVTSALAP
ncbi:nicotinic acetylcholine receptor alpha 8 isoform 1 [Penaeus vannamei]|uniref:Nicotinic acetylcholine receptor alpha 8 isoform 1 n=1 Tax=Penaeus vannamei TaxID=6689 RepID=A0A3R7PWV0_PENVA|nr:nicotinic acetylcholine receptor alpha 8 isoform 1 [Penaeus vannamei]